MTRTTVSSMAVIQDTPETTARRPAPVLIMRV
jgi:hypothetical protein